MARTYGKIHTRIWRDPDYKALTHSEQWLYEALISQSDLSLCGLILYRPGRWSKLASDVSHDDVHNLLLLLEEKRYLCIDWDTEEVLIRSFSRNDGGAKHGKILIGIKAAIKEIESDSLRNTAASELQRALTEESSDPDPDGNRLTTDTQSIANPDPIESDPDQLAAAAAVTTDSRTTSSSSEQAIAAAALGMYIEYRCKTDPAITNPGGFKKSVSPKEWAEHGERMIQLAELGRSPRQIITTVYGLSPNQLTIALGRAS